MPYPPTMYASLPNPFPETVIRKYVYRSLKTGVRTAEDTTDGVANTCSQADHDKVIIQSQRPFKPELLENSSANYNHSDC